MSTRLHAQFAWHWREHIHREVIHHGAETLLLRDLYRHGDTATGGLR